MKRMAKKETVPFRGTKEQEAALMAAIEELKDQPGSLMPIMQKAQDIYGYLPIEVQTMISDATGTPLEKIYGIATFYAQFTLEPKGEYRISVCLGTACYVKGAQAVFDKLKELLGGKFKVSRFHNIFPGKNFPGKIRRCVFRCPFVRQLRTATSSASSIIWVKEFCRSSAVVSSPVSR